MLTVAAIIFAALPTAFAADPTVAITPEESIFYADVTPVNWNFTVNATVENAINVWNWQVRISFNSSLIHCLEASIPPDSPFKFAFSPPPSINNVAGYVMLGSTQLSGMPSVNASGVLATITFEIVSEPESGASLSCDLDLDDVLTYLKDSEMTLLPATLVGGSYLYTWDTTPPEISDPTQTPLADNVQIDQDVTVSVNVTDYETGVKNVTLSYTTDNGTTWNDVPMTLDSTSGLWEADIPGKALDTWVKYKITAYDNAENPASNDNTGSYFVYEVIPEFSQIGILVTFLIATLIVAASIAWSKKHSVKLLKQ